MVAFQVPEGNCPIIVDNPSLDADNGQFRVDMHARVGGTPRGNEILKFIPARVPTGGKADIFQENAVSGRLWINGLKTVIPTSRGGTFPLMAKPGQTC